jgi:hypothetical protein
MSNQKYDRHSVAPIEQVLPLIRNPKDRNNERTEINGTLVNVSSVRLYTFKLHGTKCSSCGQQATHFALERATHGNVLFFHLNLYGEKDGQELLFTHDHTIARSAGGRDHTDNTTTMCYDCNQLKAIEERSGAIRKKAQGQNNQPNSKDTA